MAGRVECPERAERVEGLPMPFIYIVRCADRTLYVGHTDDLESREQTHNDGRGSRYTAARRPVKIVYAEKYDSTAGAIVRERQLKRWTAKKKEALISDDFPLLKSLSKRRHK